MVLFWIYTCWLFDAVICVCFTLFCGLLCLVCLVGLLSGCYRCLLVVVLLLRFVCLTMAVWVPVVFCGLVLGVLCFYYACVLIDCLGY